MDASETHTNTTTSTENVAIGLNAVLAVVEDARPKVLCVRKSGASLSLPYGPFDPNRHRTFEIGLREWVKRQTSIMPGYVEQLYTFGDMGREAPAAALAGGDENDRIISVGYLALAPEPAAVNDKDAQWRDWYEFFPWEDWRKDEPPALAGFILPRLDAWATSADDASMAARRRGRIRLAFGLSEDGEGWEEERALDRYELMYEAGLVSEALRDRREDENDNSDMKATGRSMASDHRRILATAIGRLRGKLKYRSVVFRLTPPRFTLLTLQKTVEAVVGFEMHKQNFRRSVDHTGFVARTGETSQEGGGRPAALFKVSEKVRRGRAAGGLTIPRLRIAPDYTIKDA